MGRGERAGGVGADRVAGVVEHIVVPDRGDHHRPTIDVEICGHSHIAPIHTSAVSDVDRDSATPSYSHASKSSDR